MTIALVFNTISIENDLSSLNISYNRYKCSTLSLINKVLTLLCYGYSLYLNGFRQIMTSYLAKNYLEPMNN